MAGVGAFAGFVAGILAVMVGAPWFFVLIGPIVGAIMIGMVS